MIIALDPGFGNTKVVADSKVAILQSAVAKPRQIGNAAIGMAHYEAENEIILNGQRYVTGERAWLQGETFGNMDYSSLGDVSRKILFYSALSEILPEKTEEELKATLVIGLPVQLLQDKIESNFVIEELGKSYKTLHEWESKNKNFSVRINKILVLAQPVGAWADWIINDEFRFRKGELDSEIAVMDIGMNTLDLFVIQRNNVIDKYVGGAKVGVRKLLGTMNGHGQSIEEIDHSLRMGTLQPEKNNLKSWLHEVLGQVESVWPTLKRFSCVIPVGGGAVVLNDLLKEALVKKGANVSWPENPIATNAIGLWKWANYAKK